MSNQSLLEAVEKSISEAEAKLQAEWKYSSSSGVTKSIHEWLKYLHEKRKELLLRSDNSNTTNDQ